MPNDICKHEISQIKPLAQENVYQLEELSQLKFMLIWDHKTTDQFNKPFNEVFSRSSYGLNNFLLRS